MSAWSEVMHTVMETADRDPLHMVQLMLEALEETPHADAAMHTAVNAFIAVHPDDGANDFQRHVQGLND